MNSIDKLLSQAISGYRLTLEEGLEIYEKADLFSLANAASKIRNRIHPEKIITFVIDRNINYTNICQSKCRFCAFYREKSNSQAYVLSKEVLFSKIEDTLSLGGTGILMQGGLNEDLGLDYYLDILSSIKKRYNIDIHSFSPPEIDHIAKTSGLEVGKVISLLRNSGLDSLPGGGAEILVDRVRKVISPQKISWKRWMEIIQEAQRQGMKTTATMVFGHVETLEERLLHLVRIRQAQDETGGFTAFIPWSFQPGNTDLGGNETTGVDYLRTLAISRIMLDNIPNIQTSWVTQGSKIAQIGISFGANDFGSTMLEENVVRATGVNFRVSIEEIVRVIKDAGFIPVQRTNLYSKVKSFR
ncbi:MAG: dehypoxanthine futalosine cyclase [Peptococcaceae bacterium]|nr:dehypoxanthine futalosine cyclase [Peptococcaceae bacterium]